MAGYQPREGDGAHGLSPEMATAMERLVDTDRRLVVGYRKARDLSLLGIDFTLQDVCWLSRSDCPLTAAPRGCHDGRHMAGVEGVSYTLRELRVVTTDEIRVHGYSVAYCPRCSCRKTVNGSPDWPNGYDEGCTRSTCRCHHNHDAGCLTRDGEQRCGWDD